MHAFVWWKSGNMNHETRDMYGNVNECWVQPSDRSHDTKDTLVQMARSILRLLLVFKRFHGGCFMALSGLLRRNAFRGARWGFGRPLSGGGFTVFALFPEPPSCDAQQLVSFF